MAKKSKYKARISGDVIEFWEFENPIFLEGNKGGGRRKKGEKESEKADEHRKSNTRRSRDKFKSLVTHNFSDGDKFITLTFRDTDRFDIRKVEETNKEFKKFMQRLKYKYGDFKYIAVIEFQDEHKRGAVHYHFIAKLGYVPHEDLAQIWGLGFVGINRIEGIDNIGAYISKYMAKDQGDPRLKGKKNYLPSKNLEQPTILYGSTVKDLLESYEGIKKEVFTDCYDSEHFGNITYKEYNLKRDVKQTKIGKGLQQKLIAEQQIKSLKDQLYNRNKEIENNDPITNDGTILAEIERRERKAFQRGRDQLKLLERLLESDRRKRTLIDPEVQDQINQILQLEAQEKKDQWDQWVDLQDQIQQIHSLEAQENLVNED